MKITVFLNMSKYSHGRKHRKFTGAFRVHLQRYCLLGMAFWLAYCHCGLMRCSFENHLFQALSDLASKHKDVFSKNKFLYTNFNVVADD
jgi:hypothetical protein